MKKFSKISAFMLAAAMLLTVCPLAGLAYGSTDQKLTVTHINVAPSYEGAGIICSGEKYSMLGTLGTFAWWKVVIFDWDADAKVYKITQVLSNSNNSDKSAVEIPKTGFIYGVCGGNDYSSTGGINYINQPTQLSMTYINSLKVGQTAYLYNADLANSIVQNNGKSWYASDFVSDSFIKIGDPIDGMEAYDPTVSRELPVNITPNQINGITYASGQSIILSDSYSTHATQGYGDFGWWNTVVFNWDDTENCFVVASMSTAVGNGNPKQPIIPKNGFALLDCGANTSSIANLRVGSKCWLYDINLETGKLGSSPLIRANVKDETRTAFTPTYTAARLNTPVVNQAGSLGYINTTADGITLTWDPVPGATGYTVAINNASAVADGTMLVTPKNITTNSYAIPSSILAAGGNYTFWIYATGTDKTPSMAKCYTVKCLSETAMNSSLVNKKVLAFGDSLTARTGYVSMLYGFIGTEVINAGVGGNNTNHAKARFETDVLDQNPDIVIINFGMNDQATYTPTGNPNVALDVYRENLDYFASTLTEAGIDVIFCTPNPAYNGSGYYSPGAYSLDYTGGYMDSFCDAMRQVAIKYNCGLVDINYECDFEDLSKFLLAGDGIHQTSYGHTRYAQLISDYMLASYDGIDKASMTVNCVDTAGNTVKTVNYTGKAGAHITLAVPEIDGMISTDSDIETTFVNGKTVTFTYTAESLVPVDGSGLTVDEEKLYVLGITQGTTASEFANMFTGSVVVRDSKDSADLTGSSRVGTGAIVKFGGKSYTVIMRGDLNGDGRVASADYVLVKRNCLNSFTLSDIQKKSGDANGDGRVNSGDYAIIKRHTLGTFDMFNK